MNNLQIFKKAVADYCPSSSIENVAEWRSLLDHLCDVKIFNPNEVKLLNESAEKRAFPVSIPQFQEIIMKEFGDGPTKILIHDIDQIRKQIRQTKGVLAVWKEQGLTPQQIRALQILFTRGNSKMKEICDTIQSKKKLLESISEPQMQLIQSLNQWTVVQSVQEKYKNYEQYQQINNKAIQHLYNQLKVKQVHFRSKKVNKTLEQSIHSVIGFNSKTDEKVEVNKIPKKLNDFDKIDKALVTFNAQRDLFLSPYFLRFLGFNANADPNYFYYFREYAETKNLAALIEGANEQLEQSYSLFKFWAGEIFRAMMDIFYQSSYQPVLPIELKDIEVAQYGLKVVFKHMKFSHSREVQNNIEPQLLQNVGQLILSLLRIDRNQIQTKFKNIQNRSLIWALLRARQTRQKYQDKIVPCFISFYNAQTHPLFQSIQDSKGMEIIDSFTMMFGQ